MKRILAFTVAMLLLCMPIVSGALDRATLYVNDTEWESDSILPFIESEGKMLVPVLAFATFSGIEVTQSEMLGSLLISSGEKYLSYNLSFGSVLDESGNIEKCDVYRYGGQIYLEPYAVCEKFGLNFESKFAPDGYLAARISDNSAALDFGAMLSSYTDTSEVKIPYLYNPTGKTVEGTFVHPILLVPSAINVDEAIAILGKNRVTFAISPDEIENYAPLLSKIYAHGHTLAYYMPKEEFANVHAFSQKMRDANDYLFSLTGKTCRVYVCAEEYDKIPKISGYFAKSCRLHLVVDDLRTDVMVLSALYYSPNSGSYNFSLASDRTTRKHYSYFFRRLAEFNTLRSMPITESSSLK